MLAKLDLKVLIKYIAGGAAAAAVYWLVIKRNPLVTAAMIFTLMIW